jgi:hypothetical protein
MGKREGPELLLHAPIPGRNATSLVPSAQLQRREIDIGFVGLGSVKGTTAVTAKPPWVRISTAAAPPRWWGSQLDCRRPSCEFDKPPRRGDYEVCHLPLLSGEVPSPPSTQRSCHVTCLSLLPKGGQRITQMSDFYCCLGITCWCELPRTQLTNFGELRKAEVHLRRTPLLRRWVSSLGLPATRTAVRDLPFR